MVIGEAEAGNNVERLSGCAADATTMRRWVNQFRGRGVQAVGWLLSTLLTVYEKRIGSIELRNRTLLKQLTRLLREYPIPEIGGVIGRSNIILTTQNCGFL
jgi:hypothetical protein